MDVMVLQKNKIFKFQVLLIILFLFSLFTSPLFAQKISDQIQLAEKAFIEKSYQHAFELYSQIDQDKLSPSQAQWVQFRKIDSQIRNLLSTEQSDKKQIENLRKELQKIAEESEKNDFWAEVTESLGDSFLINSEWDRYNQTWQYYSQAIEYWKSSTKLDKAQNKYMGILLKQIDTPPNMHFRENNILNIPLEVLNDALKIARTQEEKALIHISLARKYLQQFNLNPATHFIIQKEFQRVIDLKKTTPWYDCALFEYASWLTFYGKLNWLSAGNYNYTPDYPKALQIFRTLTKEFTEEESPYYKRALMQIDEIENSQIQLFVHHFFLPDSQIEFNLNYRNEEQINIALYPIDLTHDIKPTEKQLLDSNNYLDQTDVSGKTPVYETILYGKNDYNLFSTNIVLNTPLKPGAYLLEAKGKKSDRNLILITEMGLIYKTDSGYKKLIYACNPITSEPIAGAEVKLLLSKWDNEKINTLELNGTTGTNGILEINLPSEFRAQTHFSEVISAVQKDHQAIFFAYSYSDSTNQDDHRIYVFSDRPAYRPGEKVEWKVIVRAYDGETMKTPQGMKLKYGIIDPQNKEILKEIITLNQFGSAAGSLNLTTDMKLGEYKIVFYDPDTDSKLEYNNLFRLEEYRLPEYKVNISFEKKDVSSRNYRIGDTIKALIKAEYFFGEPLIDADVDIYVFEKIYYHTWKTPQNYPWLYDEPLNSNWNSRNNGKLILNEVLKTDANGEVNIHFDTPINSSTDLEYIVRADITDSSRRTISGSNSLQVTRQSYYVKLTPSGNIIQPTENVNLNIFAQNASQEPYAVDGNLEIKRKYKIEKWLSPEGKLFEGEELEQLKSSLDNRIFPPPTKPGQTPWILKFRGYGYETIAIQKITIDKTGKQSFSFIPKRAGCYEALWKSDDFLLLENGEKIPWSPVTSKTLFWVANKQTRTLEIHQEGINIIPNQDTAQIGNSMPVIIQTDTPRRYILFTIESANRILQSQVIFIENDTKLIDIPIVETYSPNIFFSANMLSDKTFFQHQTEIIVPPLDNFLNLEIIADASTYQPRESGKIRIKATDSNGLPVSTELALGISDESVYHIQQEYAEDPRAFFFKKRYAYNRSIQTYHSLWKPLVFFEQEKLPLPEESIREESESIVFSNDSSAMGKVYAGSSVKDSAPMLSRRRGVANDSMEMELSKQVQAERDSNMNETLLNENISEPLLRNNFSSTIFWEPFLQTDSEGYAEVEVKYPDNLTEWRLTARANTKGNQFGIQTHHVKVSQPLMIRLQGPRFLTVGDEILLTALVNNSTESPLTIKAHLEYESGDILQFDNLSAQDLTIPAKGENKVEWKVKVIKAGNVKVKAAAISEKYTDAMEKSYTVYEHGIEKSIITSGMIKDGESTITLQLPEERQSTSLSIHLTPSLAMTMLDAIPYLLDYPYGCTEQTMSRFLPAVIVSRTLSQLNLKPEEIEKYLFKGKDSSITTPRSGEKKPLDQLSIITQKSLDYLYDYQHDDGSWGWWKDSPSDAFMTAYVVWGLALAQNTDIEIKKDTLSNAIQWLDKNLVNYRDQYDIQAWILHALCVADQNKSAENRISAFLNLYEKREFLNSYSRALLTLSAVKLERTQELEILIRNLSNGVIRDQSPDTALILQSESLPKEIISDNLLPTTHWGNDGISWHWSGNRIEATAFTLSALIAADPESELIQPTVNWLIKNRRGTQWNNTRDTAICLLSLCDFLLLTKEHLGEIEYSVEMNGNPVDSSKLKLDDLAKGKREIWISNDLLYNQANKIKITKLSGNTPLYFSVIAKYFSKEEPIAANGNEIFIRRQYYRLEKIPTLLQGPAVQKVLLKENDTIDSGDKIEVVLTVESKNNYEYLLIEDFKPAGLESSQTKSGTPIFIRELSKEGISSRGINTIETELDQEYFYHSSTSLWKSSGEKNYTGRIYNLYQELRDQKIAFFIDQLPEGIWELRYELQAETPGNFHGLPSLLKAMYVPELKSNSDEFLLKIIDKTQTITDNNHE